MKLIRQSNFNFNLIRNQIFNYKMIMTGFAKHGNLTFTQNTLIQILVKFTSHQIVNSIISIPNKIVAILNQKEMVINIKLKIVPLFSMFSNMAETVQIPFRIIADFVTGRFNMLMDFDDLTLGSLDNLTLGEMDYTVG